MDYVKHSHDRGRQGNYPGKSALLPNMENIARRGTSPGNFPGNFPDARRVEVVRMLYIVHINYFNDTRVHTPDALPKRVHTPDALPKRHLWSH